jgi:hypothetical protein
MRSMENTTAAASSGVPSVKVTSGRSFSVQVVKSAELVTPSASWPLYSPVSGS